MKTILTLLLFTASTLLPCGDVKAQLTGATAITIAATNVAQATATLNGSVNPNGGTAGVIFEWGLTTAYGDTAPSGPITVTGSTVTYVTANLIDLSANTTYHFRLRATKNGVVTHGDDVTFTTLTAGNVCISDPSLLNGMMPMADNIACVLQGQAYLQTFSFRVPASIQGVPLDHIRFDSILNLPSGLTYTFYSSSVNVGERGCFIISGTTSEPCGQYTMPIYVTVYIQGGNFYPGELSSLADQFGWTGFERRLLRVIAPGGTCPAVDTTQNFPFNADITCGTRLSVIMTQTNVNCYGQSTGSGTVAAEGGSPPYSYVWSVNGTTATVNNLTAGTFYVTITDADNTSVVDSVTITQPASNVSVTTSTTQSACAQNTGSATATPSGGTSGYFYIWSNNRNSATISNVGAGTYFVTITDLLGCTSSSSAIITTPVNFSLSIAKVNTLCYGESSGSATVSISGSAGPFTYAWSNGETAATTSNLAAGSYLVTVSDVGGCVAIAPVTILQPANPLIASASSTTSSCTNSTGSVTVTVTNNIGTAIYNWSNGASSASINNLPSGIYQVTVTAGTCTATATTVISNSDGPALNLLKTDPTCSGSTDGSANAVVTGGTAPYVYVWSNLETTFSISNLTAGTYTLIVSDSTGCQATGVVTLVQPAALTVNGFVADVDCNGGQTGGVVLAAKGGIGPYIYQWSNGGSNSSLVNIPIGNYQVTVTDSKSCTVSSAFTIAQPTSLIVSAAATGSTGGNGTATVSVSGGSSPYNYTWNTNPVQNTLTATALAPNQYTVTVTDVKGCSATASAVVVTLVGIAEAGQIITGFSLFPNPANAVVHVVIALEGNHSVEMKITDINGKAIYTSREITNGNLTQQIEVKEFTAGVYILEVTAEKQTIRKRFMIIR